jgi:NADH-quinone oxidoreductase subunit L
MLQHVYLIPLIPLAASLVMLFLFKEDKHSPAPFIGIAAMLWCFLQSCVIFYHVCTGATHLPYEMNIEWFRIPADVGGHAFPYTMLLGVLIDGPAAVMLCVVTLVSSLVQIYSLSYMHDDPRFRRYFAFLSFFTASMLGLIVSSNLFVTFMCWELVGVSSYLLIGFWFEKPGPAYASKKAFMTTKLGDCGLYVALLLIFAKVGSFQITQLQLSVQQGILGGAAATAVGLGLLFGAVGKSAQWPLFIWLPDAMEGPTPVSALIHAATMVAAGIYLVGKTYFIYQVSPVAMETVAWVGLITAFLAATMAVVAYDIKRVLAFSTVSQLGFMMCALGAGGYTAGLFHLTTHAFFKALLFLGAGSVIHAVHTNDMREMGGLSKKMPVTFVTMFIATLAISGFPFLSGWYSKDMIIEKVYEHNPVMCAILIFSAMLTAFYMFRMIFLTFTGADRDHDKHHHAHESPLPMTVPLVILAVLSVFSGMALSHNGFVERLLAAPGLPEAVSHAAEAAGDTGAPRWLGWAVTFGVFCSIGFSWMLYQGPKFETAEALKKKLSPLVSVLEHRYGFDLFFLWLVDLADALALFCFWFDANIIDKVFVDGWAMVAQLWAHLSEFFDNVVIDRTVDGFGGLSWDLGVGLRSLARAGQVQEYLMYVAIAVSLFATLILTR